MLTALTDPTSAALDRLTRGRSAVRLVPGAAVRGERPRLADARPAADGRRAAGRAAPPARRPVPAGAARTRPALDHPSDDRARSGPDDRRRRPDDPDRRRSVADARDPLADRRLPQPRPGLRHRVPADVVRQPGGTGRTARVPGDRDLLRRTGDRPRRHAHRRRPGRGVRRVRAAGAARGHGVAARPDRGPVLAERTDRHRPAVAGERPAVLAAPDRRRRLGTGDRAGVLPLPDRRRAGRARLREERRLGRLADRVGAQRRLRGADVGDRPLRRHPARVGRPAPRLRRRARRHLRRLVAVGGDARGHDRTGRDAADPGQPRADRPVLGDGVGLPGAPAGRDDAGVDAAHHHRRRADRRCSTRWSARTPRRRRASGPASPRRAATPRPGPTRSPATSPPAPAAPSPRSTRTATTRPGPCRRCRSRPAAHRATRAASAPTST